MRQTPKALMDYFVSQGLSRHHAAAVVANMQAESGLDSSARNSGEGAEGLMQWRNDRLANGKRWVASQGKSWDDPMAQASYALHEGKTTEKANWDKFLASGDAGSGAAAFDQFVERSDGRARDKRVRTAQDLYGGTATMSSRNTITDSFGNPDAPSTDGPLTGTPNPFTNGQPESYDALAQSTWTPPASDPVMSSKGPLDSTAVEPDSYSWYGRNWNPDSFMGKFAKWGNKSHRGDYLLAIGNGLLSGNNWREGISAAGTNMLELSNLFEDQRIREEAYGQRDANDIQNLGTIKSMTTGEQIGGVYARGGRWYTIDGTGTEVPIPNQADYYIENRSDANTMMLEPQQWMKAADGLISDANALMGFDRAQDYLSQADGGAERFVHDMSAWTKAFMGLGLSNAEITQMALRGELATVGGASRLEIGGPGVMTEQDFQRIIQAMGGDWQSYLDHPDLLKSRLSIMWKNKLNHYNQTYDQMDEMQKRSPNKGGLLPERYTPKYQVSESSRDDPGVGALGGGTSRDEQVERAIADAEENGIDTTTLGEPGATEADPDKAGTSRETPVEVQSVTDTYDLPRGTWYVLPGGTPQQKR